MSFLRKIMFCSLMGYKRIKWLYAARNQAVSTSGSNSKECSDGKKQLFVDVSELMIHDGKTGIQRVVRAVLQEWMIKPSCFFDVQPVYAVHGQYVYARQFFSKFFNVPAAHGKDDAIEFRAGDVFLGLDLSYDVVFSCRSFYRKLRQSGVSVQFVVYDLLCIQMPSCFYRFAAEKQYHWLEIVAENDGAICISQAVADEVSALLKKDFSKHLSSFKVSCFHLGADIDCSVPGGGIPVESEHISKETQGSLSFLMVGTLEPRKAHQQVIAAFELLWRQNVDANLVIVGKEGWRVAALVHALQQHPFLNQKLFWFESASDELLEEIYESCDCLIAASKGEGFGLPLIEAARHELPIIARDIPVFHEVTQDHAFFFHGEAPEDLAHAVTEWIALFGQNKHPTSKKITWVTWRESADELLSMLSKVQ